MRPASKAAVITLTTDFGEADAYVGAVKGVILRIAPQATLVDVAHNIPPFDLLKAALVVRGFASYFPPATVHLVVVDPGVGSSRKGIIVTTPDNHFVGPDNGVFTFVTDASEWVAHEITAGKFRLDTVSNTFHARDIFAPAAAYLANGVPPEEFGERLENVIRLPVPEPFKEADGIRGEVISIDSFGNLTTNLDGGLIGGEPVTARINGVNFSGVYRSYANAPPETPFLIVGSSGLVEIAVREGRADRALKAQVTHAVKLSSRSAGRSAS